MDGAGHVRAMRFATTILLLALLGPTLLACATEDDRERQPESLSSTTHT